MPAELHDPALLKRRVLLISTGGSPAVITETLYGLIHQSQPFIPTEIHVITTQFGYHAIEQQLFPVNSSPLVDQLWTHNKAAFAGNGLPMFTLQDHVHVITNPETGATLDDITRPEHCIWAADLFKHQTFQLVNQPDTAVHCSLAGGRKIMSFFSGYVLSLAGHPHDRLSHTLIEPAWLERCSDFYFPEPGEIYTYTDKRTKEQKQIASADIRITIVNIPFAPILKNDAFRDDLAQTSLSYSQAIERVNQLQVEVVPHIVDNCIQIGNDILKLSAQEMALYLLLLRHPDGFSAKLFSAEQAIEYCLIHLGYKDTETAQQTFNKLLRTQQQRQKFLPRVIEQIRRKLKTTTIDSRDYYPPKASKTGGLYKIPQARKIAAYNPLRLQKLSKENTTKGLSDEDKTYIRQHFNQPIPTAR